MTPDQVAELLPLRKVVAAQFARPVMPTEQGFSDLVDRVTVAVAVHLGRTVPSTAEQARRLADAMEPPFACPECGEPYRPVLVGTPDQGLSCTHRSGCTWWSTRDPGDVHRFPQEYRGGTPQGDGLPADGGSAPPGSGTVDGIRPHRPVTPEQDARMKQAAEQLMKDNPMTPERAAALLAGRRNPTSCLGCGQPWIDAVIRHLPHCPVGTHVTESMTPEMEAAALEGWKTHGAQGEAVASGCAGCGQLPVKTAVGRHTRHLASCTVTGRPPGGRYGGCPQTERHAAHRWTGGLGDEVRYWCDGEPSASSADG